MSNIKTRSQTKLEKIIETEDEEEINPFTAKSKIGRSPVKPINDSGLGTTLQLSSDSENGREDHEGEGERSSPKTETGEKA